MPETWLPVSGYEGLYEVSSLGQVRGLDRVVGYRNGRTRRWRGRVMAQYVCPRGYAFIKLGKDGLEARHQVHTLVAEAFLGPRPDGQVVRHGDLGHRVNEVQNLSYGTQLDNIHDKWRDQTMTNGERHPLSKLTEETVRQIRQDAGSVSVSEQARRYGVSRPTIRAVIARRTWAHVEA